MGDGTLSTELRAEISSLGLGSVVHMLGFRNQTELPELYGAADVLVLPSDIEPWGLVVNDALACGAAVVVSDQVGSGPDLASGPEAVFPAKDVARLAEIFRRLITDASHLARLKADGAARIQRWGLEQTADGFIRGADPSADRAS